MDPEIPVGMRAFPGLGSELAAPLRGGNERSSAGSAARAAGMRPGAICPLGAGNKRENNHNNKTHVRPALARRRRVLLFPEIPTQHSSTRPSPFHSRSLGGRETTTPTPQEPRVGGFRAAHPEQRLLSSVPVPVGVGRAGLSAGSGGAEQFRPLCGFL